MIRTHCAACAREVAEALAEPDVPPGPFRDPDAANHASKNLVRVAFVSQPEYFNYHYETGTLGDFEIRHFDLKWSEQYEDFRSLVEYKPDVTIVFRGEIVPIEVLRDLGGIKVALSSEPFPKFIGDTFHYTFDSVERLNFFSRIRDLPYDYVFHYDAASRRFLEKQGFYLSGYFQFPIALSSYKPMEIAKTNDIFFIGRSTPHREAVFGPLKRDFKFLHIAHGIYGRELIPYICSSRICLNMHAFPARFAEQMRKGLGWDCELVLNEQSDFSEPMTRINTHPAARYADRWSEDRAWAKCVAYYAGS